ncbi:MAG: hypothetical protein AABZ60_17250, partial [Planctomycetota bacterium]
LLELAGFFFRQQNRSETIGGKISRVKMFWLLFALTSWFLIPSLLACDSHVILPSRKLLGGFALLMWGRAGVEFLMLYVTKNWKPPLGIAHDLCCILFLGGGLLYFYADFKEFANNPFQRWIWSFILLLVLSLCVEIFYAFLFFRAVEGKTTGEEGIWFASEEDTRFQTLNRLTFALNFFFYSYLVLFFVVVWL